MLLDGHTRFALCMELGIPFEVRLIHLPDRQACLDWISRHQRDRRNLGKNGLSYSRGKHYLAERLASGRPGKESRRHGHSRYAEKGGQSDHVSLSDKGGQNDHLSAKERGGFLKTASRLAKFHAVGERTIRRDKSFAVAVDDLTANCGDLARALVLPAGAPLQRRDTGRLLKLEPDEQRRLLAQVHERGRSALPWFRRKKDNFLLPRDPGRLAAILLQKLGKVDAGLVRDRLTNLIDGPRTGDGGHTGE